MKRALPLVAFLAALFGSAWAQSTDENAAAWMLRALEGKASIEDLRAVESRLEALEDASAQEPPEPEDPEAPVRLLQYGPNFNDYWGGEDAFLNALAQYDVKHLRQNFGADFNEATGEIAGMNGGGPHNIGWLRFSREIGAPEAYFDRAYFIEWEGDADLRVASSNMTGVTFAPAGTNRLQLDIPAGHDRNIRVRVHSIGARPLKNWRAYEARHADLVAAGKTYRPEYLEALAPYNVVRPMNWSAANSLGVTRVEQLVASAHPAWGGRAPLDALVALATESGAALWLNAPPALGAPLEAGGAAFLEPPADEASADPLWKQRQSVWEAGGGRHARTIIESEEYLAYARMVVARLAAAGYPEDRRFYVELGNEIWNYGGSFARQTRYFVGIGKTIAEPPLGGARFAYGYLSAKLAAAFERAFSEAGRAQDWTLVLATQTVNPFVTEIALKGADAWFAENDPAGKDRLAARFGVATTNYYYGAFGRMDRTGGLYGVKNRDEYCGRLLKDIEEDPEGLSARIVAFMKTGDDLQIPGVIAKMRQHQDLARKWGGFYVGNYEGSSHDALECKGEKTKAYASEFFQSEHNADVLRAFAREFYAAFPDAMLSNFVLYGKIQSNRPWIEAPPGVDTPAAKVWGEIAAGRFE